MKEDLHGGNDEELSVAQMEGGWQTESRTQAQL